MYSASAGVFIIDWQLLDVVAIWWLGNFGPQVFAPSMLGSQNSNGERIPGGKIPVSKLINLFKYNHNFNSRFIGSLYIYCI